LQTYQSTTNGPSTTSSSSSTTEQAKEKAREQAQQAAGQARGTLRTQVDQRSTEAGERVGSLASDVRSVGEQLREQGKDQPAKLADQAAERAESLSRYLTGSDGDRILGDIEDFGRRQPWAVIGGGVVLGLLASRFLKASSTRRYEERYDVRRAQLPARTTYGPTYGTTSEPPATRTDLGAERPSQIHTPPITTPGVTDEPTYQGGR
jgi:hypothetical protein